MPRGQRCKPALAPVQTSRKERRRSRGCRCDRAQARLEPRVETAGRLLRAALRHQSTSKARLARAQSSLGEGEMDDVALREAAAATMRDALHRPEPFDARRVIAARE